MSGISELAPGTIIGGAYRIQQHLRDGGQGAIYVAEQIGTGHLRALKLMLPTLVGDERLRELFINEARIGVNIRSDHVVQVISAGIDEPTGMPWMAMELLEGEDLADLLARREYIEPHEVLEIFEQLCHALLAAHMVGIVHRDLKPENIFLAEARRPGIPFTLKVLDFGLAKLIYEAQPSTGSGVAKGTWSYLSPEQTEEHGSILPATDVWALGLLVYRLLTGHSYWATAMNGTPSIQVLLREILHDPLPPPSERAERFGIGNRIPPGFDAWFGRCVVRDTEVRFRDAGEAGEALKLALTSRSTRKMNSVAPLPTTTPTSGELVEARTSAAGSTGTVPSVPPAPRPRRRYLVTGLVAAAALASGMLEVASNYRAHHSQASRLKNCEAPTIGHASAHQLDDCAHACDSGSSKHCRIYADLVLRDPAPEASARRRATSAYHQACDEKDLEACFHYGQLLEAGAMGKPEMAGAASVYDKACALGQLASCERLGLLLDDGKGIPRDRVRALQHLYRACDGGLGDSCARIAALIESSKRDESDFENAVSLHEQACKHGKLDSCTRFGRLKFLGRGTPRDAHQAADLFQRACDGGDAPGCYELARHSLYGEGIARDPKRALALFQRLCEQHDADGCAGLSLLYRDGLAVTRDPKRAAQLAAEACDGGRARACSVLGQLVDAGQGFTRKDHPRALALFQQSCDAGDGVGCRSLAEVAEKGRGVRRDKARAHALYDRAFSLFKTGCENGVSAHCVEQAHLLLDGKIGQRDFTRAATLLDQACQWDDAPACGQLGTLFVAGHGVPRDVDRGQKLLQRACAADQQWACAQSGKMKPVAGRANRPGKNARRENGSDPKVAAKTAKH